ncbi:ATP-dependent nuclease [Plantactinospora sp. CA-290183]|uniref:ATP-dependent nuclease n=1 Tax=Plantactinospora sp. CA-290183 TaxID=3240006 RepID=UPI003D933D87
MLKKIIIRNYKQFQDFTLDLNAGMNVIVGDNDVGKSNLLEAINLALTGRLRGNPIAAELSPFLVNLDATHQYIQALRSRRPAEPPEILIEVYFDDTDDLATLKGTNNSLKEPAPGVKIRIAFNRDFIDEYAAYAAKPGEIAWVPTEYYQVEWTNFAGAAVTARGVPATASLIDATAIRLQNGADAYLQSIIGASLDAHERVELSRSYRSLRETFSGIPAVKDINAKLAGDRGEISDRELTLSIDISQRTGWERSLVPHLDELPFPHVGKGEQSSLKILLALNEKIADTHVVLIEEPENHLSFSSLNQLVHKIGQKCADKQVLVTTHSAYILNKLGLDELILLTPAGGKRITDLARDTVDYFKKLSGYDTLRLVLAKRAILVEGPSDELIVTRAYRDEHGREPIADGVDIINVRGLSAARFLDLAVPLAKPVAVVNDNDGDATKMRQKYDGYDDYEFISIHVAAGAEKTLEPQVLAANGLARMNEVLGKSYTTDDEMLDHMTANKTGWALAAFESDQSITMPEYIRDAVRRR